MKIWTPFVAAMLLMITWSLMVSRTHGEPVLAKKPFAEFPLRIGNTWTGESIELTPEVLDVLKASDHLLRKYVTRDLDPSGSQAGALHSAPLWLFVAYYQSQRTGISYHSPKNCFPGAGWQIVNEEFQRLTLPDGLPITINKVVVEKGLAKQVVFYWYHDRGRVVASEYWAKVFLIWDAISKNRTDGALVRISIPVTTTIEEASQQGLAFLRASWAHLQAHMPSPVVVS